MGSRVRYGFSSKRGRCHTHCLNLTVASIRPVCTVPVVKFYVFGAFIYIFIAPLVVLNKTVMWGVDGVKIQIYSFSQCE